MNIMNIMNIMNTIIIINIISNMNIMNTSLLRRLQAQTLPDATPPIDKILPFSKIALIFEPVM